MKSVYILTFFLFAIACQPVDKTVTKKDEPAQKPISIPPPPPKAKQEPKANMPKGEPTTAVSGLAGSQFKTALVQMTSISYDLKNYKEVPGEANTLNSMINLANRSGSKNIPTIDVSKVRLVRRAFIKGTESMGENLYPRASVEAWECTDEETAIAKIAAIDNVKSNYPWDVISKSPITYWRQGREIVFIIPGGFYMLEEVPKLQKFLSEKM